MNRFGAYALILTAALAGTFSQTAPASAAMSEQQLRERITTTYGVKVLRMRRGEIDGASVFFVTVMNPKGDFNEAFQVNTLAIDSDTGMLVSGFRNRPSGISNSAAPRNAPNRQPTDALRQGRSWR